jgi:hypothetical protein
MAVESDPAFGSVSPNAWIRVSPAATSGRRSAFSSSEPYLTIGTEL